MVTSQMSSYSLHSALLLTRAHRLVVHYVGNRLRFGTHTTTVLPVGTTGVQEEAITSLNSCLTLLTLHHLFSLSAVCTSVWGKGPLDAFKACINNVCYAWANH